MIQTPKKLVVSTGKGNFLVDPRRTVLASLGSDKLQSYGLPASQISKGDSIFVSLESLDVSSDELYTALKDDTFYLNAFNQLYLENSLGQPVPVLRNLLWLADSSPVSRNNLEQRILFEPGFPEFSDSELDEMSEIVIDSLGDLALTENHIKLNWLGGNTLAPRNWKSFKLLAENLNSDFMPIYESKEEFLDTGEPQGFYWNYIFYANARRVISRYANTLGRHQGGKINRSKVTACQK